MANPPSQRNGLSQMFPLRGLASAGSERVSGRSSQKIQGIQDLIFKKRFCSFCRRAEVRSQCTPFWRWTKRRRRRRRRAARTHTRHEPSTPLAAEEPLSCTRPKILTSAANLNKGRKLCTNLWRLLGTQWTLLLSIEALPYDFPRSRPIRDHSHTRRLPVLRLFHLDNRLHWVFRALWRKCSLVDTDSVLFTA